MLGEVDEEEEDMLDLAWGLTDTSRLCCQIKATKELDGMVLKLPDETHSTI
jgi:ferredoxin